MRTSNLTQKMQAQNILTDEIAKLKDARVYGTGGDPQREELERKIELLRHILRRIYDEIS